MRREDCDRTWVWKQGVEHVRETQFMKTKTRNTIYENGLEYARGQSESLERKAEVCVM